MNKTAFTLAEVLITLAIIGVVAAISIPSLMQDIQNADLQTKWKKSFSEISAATRLINSNGEDIDFTSSTNVRTSYSTVMKFVKQGSWSDFASTQYTFYTNTSGLSGNSNYCAALLPNGSIVGFNSYADNCSTKKVNLEGICGYIYVDTNGKRGPNMFGRDYLVTWIVKKNGEYIIYPVGSNGDGYSCQRNSDTWGTSDGCSAVALYSDKMP